MDNLVNKVFGGLRHRILAPMKKMIKGRQMEIFRHEGYCTICEKPATFSADHEWNAPAHEPLEFAWQRDDDYVLRHEFRRIIEPFPVLRYGYSL